MFLSTETVKLSILHNNILGKLEEGQCATNLDSYKDFLKLTLKYIVSVKKWNKMVNKINWMFGMGAMEQTEEFKARVWAKDAGQTVMKHLPSQFWQTT